MKLVQENVQTTLVPSGGAAIMDFKVEVPGTFVLVDHSLTRAFNKGAIGMLKVSGAETHAFYSGKQADEIYTGDATALASAVKTAPAAAANSVPRQAMAAAVDTGPVTKAVQMERGQKVFMTTCFACHMANGEGLPNVFPPLAKSDYLKADKERAIRIVTKGLSGPVTVNGKVYNNVMPPQALDDHQVADVLTYVMNSFGNDDGTVSAADVRRVRDEANAVASNR
jgi:nitrite reductase (NO-forming)